MSSDRNVSKCTWGHLRWFAIQKDGGVGWLGPDSQSGDFLNRFEVEVNLWSHPWADLNILVVRLIVFQNRRKFMRYERDVKERGWRYLGQSAVQEDGGIGRLGLDGKRRDLLSLFEL